MTRIAATIALLLLSAASLGDARATPLVADLSNYRIDIDARFIGTRLFLFGSRNENGDIIVVIRGPKREYTVRRKERTAGVWVNRRYIEFEAAPEFYAIASSRPLAELSHPRLLDLLEIGSDTLLNVKKVSSRKLDVAEFQTAFLENQYGQGLYNQPQELQFIGDSLFKATFEFPDTIPKGDYHAEVYLLQNDQLVATQSIPINVRKVGLDGVITTLAHDSPIFYGLMCILIALSAGWTANRVFARMK